MANTPVFSAEDRVDPPAGSLPIELQGKSAEEVAAYYQKKMREQAPPKPAPRQPGNPEFWSDPAKATKDMVEAVIHTQVPTNTKELTKNAFLELAEPIKQSLIDMAEYLVSQRFPDWKEHSNDVKAAMQSIEPWARTQQNMWETTFFYVRGKKNQAPVTPGSVVIPGGGPESGSPAAAASVPNPNDAPLSSEEEFVRDHMGISKEQYRKAQASMQSGGRLPLTYDNRRGASR